MRVLASGYKLTLDPGSGELSHRGRSGRLRPKTAAVLVHLAVRPDRVVNRGELLEVVWRDQEVGDHVVTQSVMELRRILAQLGADGSAVETIPWRGYRLRVGASPAPRRPWWLAAGSGLAGGIALVGWLVAASLPGFRDADPAASPVPMLAGRTEPVTSLPGEEGFASISGDGHVIAFRHEAPGQRGDIYLTGPTFADPIPLTRSSHDEHAPAVSPDGRHVAYFAYPGERCVLFIMPVQGGNPRAVGECHPVYLNYADWSPDGRLLAFTGPGTGTSSHGLRLTTVEVESGRIRALDYPGDAERHDFMPRFSPDGRWLAFLRGSNPDYELRVMPAAGGRSRGIDTTGRAILGFGWTPDGSALVMPERVEGIGALAWVDYLSGKTVRRVLVGRTPLQPSVAARSGTIVFNQYRQNAAIFRLPLDGSGDARVVQSSSGLESAPVYAPGSPDYVFVSSRSGRRELWLADAGREAPTRLTRLEEGAASNPAWSPDGERLLFVTSSEGQRRLMMLHMSTREIRPVSPAGETVLSGSFSSDGRRIFYEANRDGAHWIVKIAPDGTGKETLVRGRYPRTVPGDPRVYFRRIGEGGLWRIEAEGGSPELAYDVELASGPHGWQPVGDGIVVLGSGERGGAQLYRLPGTGEQAEPSVLAKLERTPYDWNFTLAPDGQSALIALNEVRDSDIVRLESVSRN